MLDPLSLCIDTSPATQPLPSGPPRRLLIPSPSHSDDYILEVDYSSISSYLECPRMGENVLVYARQSRSDETPLNFGRLFHSCEELRLRFGATPEVFARQRELVFKHYVDHPVSPMEYRNAARMIDTLERYNRLYSLDGWPDRVLIHEDEKFVERPYKIELCTIPVNAEIPYSVAQIRVCTQETMEATEAFGHHRVKDNHSPGQTFIRNIHIILTGRIDAVITDSNALWVVDHKTSSRGGDEFTSAFNLSLQTRGYAWAVRELGIPVAGLMMNAAVVHKPTAKSSNTEFQRHVFAYSSDILDEYADNMKSILSDFVHSLTRGFFPQHSRSFKSPCAGCDYQFNCRLPRDQRHADLMSSLYADITWSPLHE